MKTGILNKVISFLMTALLISSCIKNDVYMGTEQEVKDSKSGPEYAIKFSNYNEINVSITSGYTNGRFYSVFAEYPYDEEGSIIANPIMTGLTPIEGQISVPAGADNLYVLSDEGVYEYPVGDLQISDNFKKSSSMSRANDDEIMTQEQMAEVIRQIDNELIPECNFNVKKDNLYKCTDLLINDLPANQYARVWLTYLGDGGFNSESNFWFYTYKAQNPHIDDCSFYGLKDGKFTNITFNDVKSKRYFTLNSIKSKARDEIELPMELFSNDTYMGFVFIGNSGPRFTTPSLNTPENNGYDYIDKTMDYKDGEVFKIEKNINSGAIMHFDNLGKQYNVVGMENRLPGESSSYDGDYNDMLVLIRSNPENIAPVEVMPKPELTFTTYRQGYWMFEDNYPKSGDFDFNDVVIAYNIQKSGNIMDITCKLVASRCSFSNTVGIMLLPDAKSADGWKNPTYKDELWSGISGYFNVGDEQVDFTNCKTKKVRYLCNDFNLIRPYINNGNGNITLDTYNTGDYPYALDIPSLGTRTDNTNFRWMKEGQSLDAGYYFLKAPNGDNRIAAWYWNSQAKNKELLINRPDGMIIW